MIERRLRYLRATVGIPAAFGAVLLLLRITANEKQIYESTFFGGSIVGVPIFGVVVGALFLLSFAGWLLIYLQTGWRSELAVDGVSLDVAGLGIRWAKRGDSDYGKLSRRISFIEQRLATATIGAVTRINVTKSSRRSKEPSGRSVRDVVREALVEIERRIEQRHDLQRRIVIAESAQRTLERLQRELAALTRRGNVNLVLGIVSTTIGIWFLFRFVTELGPIPAAASPWHYQPVRAALSFVIIIEVFAYFFLALYKSSLAEIKFFQNEITNVEAKTIALSSALSSSDVAVATDVIRLLAQTERNYVARGDASLATASKEV
jgi:hypothetical protein